MPIFERLSRPKRQGTISKRYTPYETPTATVWKVKEQKVKKSKTYFEQIPVEVVKKIAKELPEKIQEEKTRNGKRGFKIPNGKNEPASRAGGFASGKGV